MVVMVNGDNADGMVVNGDGTVGRDELIGSNSVSMSGLQVPSMASRKLLENA